jgi:hypothetical protein
MRKRIKAVMAHYFRRQEKAVLAAVKPHIERQLMLHPVKEVMRLEPTTGAVLTVPLREAISPQGRTFASALLPSTLQPLSVSFGALFRLRGRFRRFCQGRVDQVPHRPHHDSPIPLPDPIPNGFQFRPRQDCIFLVRVDFGGQYPVIVFHASLDLVIPR